MSDIDEQAEDVRNGGKRASDGARVEMRDSRMSALVGIGLASTPLAVLGIGAWIASSIADLNVTVAKLVTQNEAIFRRLDDNDHRDDRQDIKNEQQDENIDQLGRDIASMGGPNYRGPRRGH